MNRNILQTSNERIQNFAGNAGASELFSIIMPTYNRVNVINQTLDSVFAQSYRPIEIIIVDDGSTDETASLVDAWKLSHEEENSLLIKYVYQNNAGPSAARNRGLAESSGEFIQFLDSDDLIPPERLEILAGIFQQDPDVDFIHTGFDGFCADCGEVIETHYGKPDQDQLEVALKGRLWPNTLRSAFKRSLAVATGPWNEEMTCFEDYEYVVRAIGKAKKCVALREILASARRGGGMRVSDNLRTYQGRTFRIMAEAALCEVVRTRTDVSQQAKEEFASRLYALGFRSAASGWPDLAKCCGELADSLGGELDWLGKRRRFMYRLGKFGGIANSYLGRIKNWKKHQKKKAQGHVCGKKHQE
ncbi:MAG: glycosyltransferase family A protein [Candidatus Electrothrix sp. GW3-4]|uniref:glycosyltransferase family A protein n=1 Tax=Candidatus Electrothrix sp. GW3-4 TaxID=3126740 RepID=UPI0030CF0CAC